MKKAAYALLLTGALVLVSFRGGTIPWLLLYFLLMIPVLAVLYVLYVYCRFRIGQNVARTVNKGEKLPYHLELANEDFLLISGIGLNFYTDMTHVMERGKHGGLKPYRQEKDRISLLPYQKSEVELELYCKYRGTYPVGVKSVSVTDFFGLFTITYPMLAHIRLTARPRILTLEQLQSSLARLDAKRSCASLCDLQELLDLELRKYVPGDPIRCIHWKNSAKTGELLVRKQMPQELYEMVVLMDCSPLQKEGEKRLQAEDNIIEATLALLYDACKKGIPASVIFWSDKPREIEINDLKSFDRFYNLSAELIFRAAQPLEKIWETYSEKLSGNPVFWLVAADMPQSLIEKAERSRRMGKETVLMEVGDEPL